MIPRDVVDLVRDRADIVAVVRERVPSLRQRGRSFTGLCPFHNEKSPSFSVNPDKGFFYCFGCKKGGSVIDFVMEADGLTFREAVRDLGERFGVEVREERDAEKLDDEARRRKDRDLLYAVNHAAATFFERALVEHPLRSYALAELARRDLVPTWADPPGPEGTVDETLRAFRIGYAPAGWDELAKYLRGQGFSLGAAEAAGLVVPKSDGTGYFDRFHHRLMFAVMDVQGRVIAFSGRALEPPPDYRRGVRPGEKIAKYINSPESAIYTKGHTLFGLFQARNALLQSKDKTAIVVEGNFDVVSLHAKGFVHAMAPLGTAITRDQLKLLRTRAQSVVFLLDADEAGKKGVLLGREAARAVGLPARVATLPADVHDPDELVRQEQGVERLQDSLSRAKGALEYALDILLDASFVSANAMERAERVQAVSKILAEEDDPLVRSMAKAYADKLAGRLDLVRSEDAFRALEASVMRALRVADRAAESEKSSLYGRSATPPEARRARIVSKPPGSVHRGAMIGALIDFPELLDDDDVAQAASELEATAARIVAALSQAWTEAHSLHKPLDTQRFLTQIPEEARAFISARLSSPKYATRDEAKFEFLQNAHHLRALTLRRETAATTRAIESAGATDEELVLLRESSERARRVHGLPDRDPAAGAVAAAPSVATLAPGEEPARHSAHAPNHEEFSAVPSQEGEFVP
jgi:DNA primase